MSDENEIEEQCNTNGKVQFRRKDGVEKDGYICFPVDTPAEEVEEDEAEVKEKVIEQKEEPERVNYTLETCQEDPRFQQQNKTVWCYRMYVDYHRCRLLLGEGAKQCNFFYKCYHSICPNAWHERWDEQREKGTFPRDFSKESGKPPHTPCP